MWLGIDPGIKGAIAMLYPDGKLYVEDMPALGKEVNAAALANTVREFPPTIAYLEKVNAFGMGRQSAFNFGASYATVKAVLMTLEVPVVEISPAKWKKSFGLSKDKDASRLKATQFFPSNADDFKLKTRADRAEAALIALYAKQNGAGVSAE